MQNSTDVATSDFAKKKNDLGNLRPGVHKLDIEKLKNIVVLNNFKSDVAKNEAVKNTEYNKLVKKSIILILLILVI